MVNRMKRVHHHATDGALRIYARGQGPVRQGPIKGISTGVNDPNGTKNQWYGGKIGESMARVKHLNMI